MKKSIQLLGVLVMSVFVLSFTTSCGQNADKPLAKGDSAPNFSIPGSMDGKEMEYSLKESLKNGPVVVYFFPSAYTQGCDLQAHTFSEHIADFKEAGVSVVGISADDINRLNDFSADPDFCAGNFPVASDPEGKVAQQFGLEFTPAREGAVDVRGDEINHGFIPRVTFVIDTDGKILGRFSSDEDKISPDEHVKKALALVHNK